MTLALLFPGQGSQYVGMGRALAEAEPRAADVLARANEILGFDLARLMRDTLHIPLHPWPTLAAVAALALLPPVALALGQGFYVVFATRVLIYALIASSLNLLIGYVGLLSFGHALFFGWGAYLSAHLAKVGSLSLPYWLGAWHWLTIPLPRPTTPPRRCLRPCTA